MTALHCDAGTIAAIPRLRVTLRVYRQLTCAYASACCLAPGGGSRILSLDPRKSATYSDSRVLTYAGIGEQLERVMGIEYIAREPLLFSNHGVASADGRCVRFMCEKQPHTSQRDHSWQFSPLLAAHRPTVSLDRRLKMRQAANMDDRAGYGV